MVNKALAVFQQASESGDMSGAGAATAEKVLNEALTYDPDCEAAVATLAQILLSSGNVEGAAVLFRKQAALARTVPDIQNALQFAFVSGSHLTVRHMYFCADISPFCVGDGSAGGLHEKLSRGSCELHESSTELKVIIGGNLRLI
jgi:hypothetical protein